MGEFYLCSTMSVQTTFAKDLIIHRVKHIGSNKLGRGKQALISNIEKNSGDSCLKVIQWYRPY